MLHASLRLAAASLAAAALASAARAQNVWVVDDTPSPGVNFSTIQAAIDAASNGDVVLIRSGAYAGFTVNGKGVSIEVDSGAALTLPFNTSIFVSNVPASAAFVLRGFQLTSGTARVILNQCAGAVWIDHCALRGGAQPNGGSGPPAVSATSCASVVVASSTLDGGGGVIQSFLNGPGGAGLFGVDSAVAIYASSLTGGHGTGSYTFTIPLGSQPGGNGARIVGGSLHVEGTAFAGGQGGGAGPGGPAFGGAGLSVSPTTTSATAYDCTFIGGPGGSPSGLPGPATDVQIPWSPKPGPHLGFFVDSPVREL